MTCLRRKPESRYNMAEANSQNQRSLAANSKWNPAKWIGAGYPGIQTRICQRAHEYVAA
jgi:hypothetical protein